MEQLINGKHPSEIWVIGTTPEEDAASERAYQARRREERRRIDAKFGNTRSAHAVPELRSHVPQARTSVKVVKPNVVVPPADVKREFGRRLWLEAVALED
jgi:hypothetical protein